ncbi:MAG TPA: phosphoribosylanthranilate isomerase [Lacipirellulaceae bacterium]|nr:phosphoribosylanthranilate isomerase [Lacipirellulaceae bacterium]
MFRIKICGLTNVGDAQAAIDAGADALGFNFYRASKRFIDREVAQQIARRMPRSVAKVGVFVDHPACDIQDLVEQFELDYIQLHGNEPPRLLAELPGSVRIVRAYRCGPAGFSPLSSYLDECSSLGRMPQAILFDADVSGNFGGTGCTIDWSQLATQRSALGDIQIVLAGGLNPTNVNQAITAAHPDAVDVASGVELQPGTKDAALMTQFVSAARAAFDQI